MASSHRATSANNSALLAALETLYPEGQKTPLWGSAFSPKLFRIGSRRGLLRYLLRLRGPGSLPKILKIACQSLGRGEIPRKIVYCAGHIAAPPGAAPFVYTQGSSNVCVLLDRERREITKILPLPQKSAEFRRESENLQALADKRQDGVPLLLRAGTGLDGTLGFITQTLAPGSPCPRKEWSDFTTTRVIPVVFDIARNLQAPLDEGISEHLARCHRRAIARGWSPELLEALHRITHDTAITGELSRMTTTTLVHHDLARHNLLRARSRNNTPPKITVIDWASAYRHTEGALLVELERQTLHYCHEKDQRPQAAEYWEKVATGTSVDYAELATPGLRGLRRDRPLQVTALLLTGLLESLAVLSPRNRKMAPILTVLTSGSARRFSP